MRALLLVAIAASFVVAGCSGGEVKPEQIDGYQSAGLKPGEKPIKATGGGDGPSER